MRPDGVKLGLATGLVFAGVWIICSVLVVIIPSPMMSMSGHMLHADLQGIGWTMHWTGFITGLVLWSVLGGLLVWAVVALYNRLIDSETT